MLGNWKSLVQDNRTFCCREAVSSHTRAQYQRALPVHSFETAFVCVQNDILRTIDYQNVVIVVRLDLSAEFDTINNKVVLQRLS